jgi:pimeloyl-ACP methyl ester carboxylesterase
MALVDLHVRVSGAGSPLVLLHAFPLSSAMWDEQRRGLSVNHRVIAPDLRGFGGSRLGRDEPSLDHMADDIAGVLDRFNLESVVLGGLSMGGYVTMAFLRRHPDRVRALVLADAKASADPEPARENRRRIADELVEEDSVRALIDEVLPKLCGETTKATRPSVIGRVRALVEDAAPASAAWAQRAMALRPDSIEVLRSATIPALVVIGAEDGLATVADGQAIADATGGELVVLPGSGHLTALEVPDEFTDVVSRFLARLS